MLSRGWHLVMQGARQLAGPLACWWLAGILLAVLAKVLGILVGGVVSLLGLLLLSAWLPAMVARSNHESWQAGQFLYRWVLLMFTAVWWLPLGWLGYLATLQASIQLPATVQNIIFNTRYDWLPVAGPLWLLGWLISWKWLPALQRQLTAPTSWRNYWRTGWRISWWTVFKKSRNVWLFLISWLVMAIISGGIVWASGAVSQLVSQFIAVFMMTGLQLLAWLMFVGWWSCLWPETAIAGHSNWQTGLLTLTGLLVLGGYAGWWLGTPPTAPLAIIAHRGVNGRDGVQNTTAALKRTVKQVQPDMVEMDIQPTADRHWVVMHDPTLKALAGQPGPVHEYPVDKLSGLPLREHGQKGYLSTFKQYFAVAHKLQQPLLVEIKSVGTADQLMGIFADNYAQRLIQQKGAVHSLDYRVIERLHQRAAQLPVGFITPFYLTDFSNSVAGFYSLQALTATREQISAAHRQHRIVYFWTVDRPLAMQRLTAMGADGLITNRPGQLRRLQGQSKHYYFYQLINWLVSWL